jgi:hypothetical protein
MAPSTVLITAVAAPITVTEATGVPGAGSLLPELVHQIERTGTSAKCSE